jgi:hypothetical protein
MEFNPTIIVEVMGLALVFVGLFKLDSINKSLGSLTEFTKHAADELKELREKTDKHANSLFELQFRYDERAQNVARRSPKNSHYKRPSR